MEDEDDEGMAGEVVESDEDDEEDVVGWTKELEDEVVTEVDEEEAEEELSELNVDPMGPNLMPEKVTFELGAEDSRVAGIPEVLEHDPRLAPIAEDPTG